MSDPHGTRRGLLLVTAILIAVVMCFRVSRNTRPAQSVPPPPATHLPSPTVPVSSDPVADPQPQTSRVSLAHPPSAPVQTGQVEVPVPPGLRGIVGADAWPFDRRLMAIHSLGKNLSPQEITALLGFLSKPVTAEPDLDPTSYNALKNDILNALATQADRPAGLTAELIRMYRDERNDEVWRCYCLQHLAFAAPSEHAAVTSVLWEAGAEIGSGAGGTALLVLNHMAAEGQGVAAAPVRALAVAAATNPATCQATRITAWSLCGRLGATNLLDEARRMAATEPDAVLRMVAIATVGYLGDTNDCPALHTYTQEPDDRIATSARGALKRLTERDTL